MRRSYSRERGSINRTFALAVIVLALIGVVIIDGSSILFAKWQLSDVADAAASDAAVAYKTSHSEQSAQNAVLQVLAERDPNAVIKKLTVDPQTFEVKLTLMKDVATLFVKHIGPLKGLTHIEMTSTGVPPPG